MKFTQIPSLENGSNSNTVTSKHEGDGFQNLVQYKNTNFYKTNNHFLWVRACEEVIVINTR